MTESLPPRQALYLRSDGVWQNPVPIAQRFPALQGLTLDCAIELIEAESP